MVSHVVSVRGVIGACCAVLVVIGSLASRAGPDTFMGDVVGIWGVPITHCAVLLCVGCLAGWAGRYAAMESMERIWGDAATHDTVCPLIRSFASRAVLHTLVSRVVRIGRVANADVAFLVVVGGLPGRAGPDTLAGARDVHVGVGDIVVTCTTCIRRGGRRGGGRFLHTVVVVVVGVTFRALRDAFVCIVVRVWCLTTADDTIVLVIRSVASGA